MLPFASTNGIMDLGTVHQWLLNVIKTIFPITDLHEKQGRGVPGWLSRLSIQLHDRGHDLEVHEFEPCFRLHIVSGILPLSLPLPNLRAGSLNIKKQKQKQKQKKPGQRNMLNVVKEMQSTESRLEMGKLYGKSLVSSANIP